VQAGRYALDTDLREPAADGRYERIPPASISEAHQPQVAVELAA
jgi:hypothetical protein